MLPTTDRQTDGRATAYSEREREFANKASELIQITNITADYFLMFGFIQATVELIRMFT